MCKYCVGNDGKSNTIPLLYEHYDMGVFGKGDLFIDIYNTDEGNLNISVADDHTQIMTINYCPMCGERLTDDEKEA